MGVESEAECTVLYDGCLAVRNEECCVNDFPTTSITYEQSLKPENILASCFDLTNQS